MAWTWVYDVDPTGVVTLVEERGDPVGEESGALDTMAGKVADFYELEVDTAVDSMASLLEPLIMVIMVATSLR
mgnify:CR=1 FL=1